MPIHYSKTFAGSFICLGLMMILMSILFYPFNSNLQSGFIGGGIISLFGVISFSNPVYVYQDRVLQARNMLGMTLFRHPLEKLTLGDVKGQRALLVVKNAKKNKTKRLFRERAFWINQQHASDVIDQIIADRSAL